MRHRQSSRSVSRQVAPVHGAKTRAQQGRCLPRSRAALPQDVLTARADRTQYAAHCANVTGVAGSGGAYGAATCHQTACIGTAPAARTAPRRQA